MPAPPSIFVQRFLRQIPPGKRASVRLSVRRRAHLTAGSGRGVRLPLLRAPRRYVPALSARWRREP